MNRSRLTSRSIAGCISDARSSGKRAERWDSDVPGLHIQAQPSGKASWYLRYQTDGARRRQRLGEAGALSPEQARELARELLVRVAKGSDPVAEAEAAAALPTLAELLVWYLTTYVKTAGKNATAKSAEGIRGDQYMIWNYLNRPLVLRKAHAIKASDLQAIRAECPASTWRKLRGVLRICFERSIELGALPPGANPVDRVKASADRRKERFLTPDERAKANLALDEARATESGFSGALVPHLYRALKLLLMAGMRRSDVLNMRWERIDWQHGFAEVFGKTGWRKVPLSSHTLEFLDQERRLGGVVRTHGLVCESSVGTPIHPNNVTRAWIRIRSKVGLDDVRLHDLRHSWASDAVSAGVSVPAIGAVLGHSQITTTMRYAHLHDEAVRQGVELAGEVIAQRGSAKPPRR